MNYLTLSFNNVFIRACSSVSGPKEKSGPLGDFFDYSFENERADQKTFEKGEVEMLKTSLEILLKKAKLKRFSLKFSSFTLSFVCYI